MITWSAPAVSTLSEAALSEASSSLGQVRSILGFREEVSEVPVWIVEQSQVNEEEQVLRRNFRIAGFNCFKDQLRLRLLMYLTLGTVGLTPRRVYVSTEHRRGTDYCNHNRIPPPIFYAHKRILPRERLWMSEIALENSAINPRITH